MGRRIITYLLDENQYGPKVIEIGNWSGKAIYAPTNYIAKLLNTRDEFNKPGIYFLKSSSTKAIYSEKIYVGEAEIVKDRLIQHLTNPNKEFDECIAFISKDSMLTKAHVRYLESKSIRIIKELNSAELENLNKPKLPSLHESDISDMNYFLEQIKIILPTVGFTCFKPNTMNIQESNSLKKLINDDKKNIYYINRNEIKARLVTTEKGFIVLKESTCKKANNKSIKQGRINLKKKLLESGILTDKGEFYVFNKDTIFNSTSEAASVILGAQTSGPQTWKDVNGNTYLDKIKDEVNFKISHQNKLETSHLTKVTSTYEKE
ncbi:GIY-YIG nuclease family protein [Clostridium estertheticum]|uniref:GIY-YIG nuclease family protein n=1 Tax=Clostridium estertheticum TaxID=238834 RepID=UPI001C0E4E0A|nr:GIY-YIG nuclease family protein [Clostridium estertheticum]MBU3176493.1 GIY-YIG nuclease family protein [Clostridium estertheticum]